MSKEIDDFLKNMGMNKQQEQPKKDAWLDLILPRSVSLILGYKGAGKSGLAYYLLDKLSKVHSLLPIVVNLPREKQYLLPDDYVIKTLEELKHTQDAVALIDEGTTMLPAGGQKLEELVKAFVALSRQRHQIIIFIFHSSSDVGSRILRGVDAILLKEPSLRQIQYGSKDKFCRTLLTEAKERFKSLADMGEDGRKYTYVDCEKPPYRGMVKNDLPEYWTEELSEAWAGISEANSLLTLDNLLGKTNLRQSYAHLPPTEILELCLACARLDEAAYDKIWKPKHQSLIDKLTLKADKYNLQFTRGLDMRGWVIRRVEAGSKCVMVTKQNCPCTNPGAAGCPVLRGNQI